MKLIGIYLSTMPELRFRWDERTDELDIDPINVSDSEQKLFRKGTKDYYGHHTKKISSNPRTFKVDIWWIAQQLYCGLISFSLRRELDTSPSTVLSSGNLHTKPIKRNIKRANVKNK